jgi:UDP-glucose 4-epimerase
VLDQRNQYGVYYAGEAGYVGNHCAKALAQAATRGSCSTISAAAIASLSGRGRWWRATSRIQSLFKTHHIDAAGHLAPLAYVGESVKVPSQYYDVNINGTRVCSASKTNVQHPILRAHMFSPFNIC